MKKSIALVCLGFAFTFSAPAFASVQQNKMKGCNIEAKDDGLKGDERKAFMKKCLSKDYMLKPSTAAKISAEAAAQPVASAAQQDKMKACNAEAKSKELKGDERKQFMSTCLKG